VRPVTTSTPLDANGYVWTPNQTPKQREANKRKRFLTLAATKYIKDKPSVGFVRDRSLTVGASEIGQCTRRLAYKKRKLHPELVAQASESDNPGYAERGNVMEDNFTAPFMARLVEIFGGKLLYAGQADQQQVVSEALRMSATPDGIAVNMPPHFLEAVTDKRHTGVSNRTVVIEMKSIDPRVSEAKLPKPEHVLQAQQQLGLIRLVDLGDTAPTQALLVYVNASDYTDVSGYVVEFDPKVFDEQKSKVASVYNESLLVNTLPITDECATECRRCEFTRVCAVGAMYSTWPGLS
jgi:hypothetical protein